MIIGKLIQSDRLLEKNQVSESDRLLLRRRSPPQASLRVSADYLMLRKAYAYAILKCQGYC
ncbi:MAG: hypothetical protein V7K83_08675 [Nostoc sp.]